MKSFLTLCCTWLLACVALAQDAAPDSSAENPRLRKLHALLDGLKFQQGDIVLRSGLARVRVPEGFRFLGPEDAETVLVKVWGNPPGRSRPLGLIVPLTAASPQASLMSENSWAIIVEYEEDGYIKDDDAGKIDYADLLTSMRKGVEASNAERAKSGYPSIELIGWATPPRYDAQAKKLYWAKEVKFGTESAHTLNYNIRMLGRRGVLVLNAVAGIGELAEIEKAAPEILAMVDFEEGHRYSDFKSGDKVATYGLAALVAGGVLAKTGLLKVLFGVLLAAKKFVIIGLLAAGSFFKKFFAKKDSDPDALRQPLNRRDDKEG